MDFVIHDSLSDTSRFIERSGYFHRIDDHPDFNTRMESFTFEPVELGLNIHHLQKMAGKYFNPDWAALRRMDFKMGHCNLKGSI